MAGQASGLAGEVEERLVERALLAAVREGLAALGDPVRAEGMRAYLKSPMPCYGVKLPDQRRLYRRVFADHPLGSFAAWRATVLALWREASFREERYAAIELTEQRAYADHQTLEALPLYEELVVTGAWWDLVDMVAVHRLGGLLRGHPAPMRERMLAWSRSDDLWKRRSAIICQVLFKRDTDLDLLYACIAPNLADRDFFIRKAIGWALRSYAWVDPDEVRAYVGTHEADLSPLSRREALKNL